MLPPPPPIPTGERHRIEANLGATTQSNFYVGFSGEIAHGGVFLATYEILPKDTSVTMLVTLPGGLEFECDGYVRFVRDPMDFAYGHLTGSVNVPLDGRFAEQAGMVVASDVDVIVAGDPDRDREAMVRLARIGFDRVIGAVADLEATLVANPEQVAEAVRMSADAVAGLDLDHVQLLDVRNPGETADGVIPGAIEIPLGALPRRVEELDASRPVVAYCASGMRSSVAASWLRANGFSEVSDVMGGYQAWNLLAAAR